MASHTYTVVGMTCDHCVAAVTRQVGQVPGVTGVHVDLATGRVQVDGDSIDDAAVGAAVDEAGYALA